MRDRPAHCQATKEHTGDYVCNRCGLYWDAGDEAPECKTWVEIKQDKADSKERELKHSREHGNNVLAKLREDLEK